MISDKEAEQFKKLLEEHLGAQVSLEGAKKLAEEIIRFYLATIT